MSLDTATETNILSPTATWAGLSILPEPSLNLPPANSIKVSELLGVHPNPSFGYDTAFGTEPSYDLGEGAHDWSACLRVINDEVLTRNRKATGSGVTRPERRSYSLDIERQLGLNDTLSHLFFYESPYSDHSVVGEKFWGIRPSDRLSGPAYATRQLLSHASGPNIDFQAESVSSDTRETLNMLAIITALGLYYPADGPRRCVSIVTAENGFQYFTIYDERKYNFVVTPPGERNPWDQQNTLRALAQQAPVHRHQNGRDDYIIQPSDVDKIPITIAPTENRFEDIHRLARAIRLLATHPDIPIKQFDIESARHLITIDGVPQLETIIGTMINLAHAMYVDGDKTIHLIEQTELDRYLPNYSKSIGNILAHVMRQPGDQKLLHEFSRAHPLAGYLASAEAELFPNFKHQTASIPPSSYQFPDLHSFAQVVAPFSPLEADDFIRCVPAPDKRERVDPLLLNWRTVDTDQGQEIVARGIEILHKLESRAFAQGNLAAAEKIRNGRKFVEGDSPFKQRSR